ncbi:MAG: AAC(3) family N-acetyltransferase, partial [Prevotella histicola]|nr:AAC(3) family N-acetyltransferase [Prevotella histicola]
MKQSYLTTLGIIFKKITGIKDISLFRKNLHKRIGKLWYHKKYTADDIIAVMCQLGMKTGSIICIHASMKEFYNYQGTAEELIKKIQNIITTEGTLIMPSYPDPRYQKEPSYIFNPKTDPT